MKELSTYKDLLAALSALSPAQLRQPIQIADPGPDRDKPVELHCGIAIGTVGQFGFCGARSVIDNRYHAGEVVLLIDGNPFAEDGTTAYELKNEGPKKNPVMRHIPIYGKYGRTPREAQYAPKKKRRVEIPNHIVATVKKRRKDFVTE